VPVIVQQLLSSLQQLFSAQDSQFVQSVQFMSLQVQSVHVHSIQQQLSAGDVIAEFEF
jgi:hypothetical protein